MALSGSGAQKKEKKENTQNKTKQKKTGKGSFPHFLLCQTKNKSYKCYGYITNLVGMSTKKSL